MTKDGNESKVLVLLIRTVILMAASRDKDGYTDGGLFTDKDGGTDSSLFTEVVIARCAQTRTTVLKAGYAYREDR